MGGGIGRWTRALAGGLAAEPQGGRPTQIGLGTFCHVAAALRAAGLRRWTGPFDWIFSTPGLVADCLDDDFSAFLDPRHLRSVPAAELTHGARRQCRHLLFEARYDLPTMFNHHDPAGSAADLRALTRSVARFREAVRCGDTTLHMMSERSWPEAELERLVGAIGALPGRNRLVLLTLAADGAERAWSAEDRIIAGKCVRDVAVRVATQSRGAEFRDPADDAHLGRVLRAIAADEVAG